jgi:hypothetical protein
MEIYAKRKNGFSSFFEEIIITRGDEKIIFNKDEWKKIENVMSGKETSIIERHEDDYSAHTVHLFSNDSNKRKQFYMSNSQN